MWPGGGLGGGDRRETGASRAEWHYRGRAYVLQSFRQNRIGVDVRKNSETLFHQNFRSRQCLNRIGKQIARVRMNLELDPLWQACAYGQPRETHRLLRVARAARIWQEEKTFRIDKVENVRERIVFA